MAFLQHLLDGAKRGDVVGLAAVAHHSDGCMEYVGAGTMVRNKLQAYAAILQLANKFL